jgi:hypothetical protein
MPLPNTRNGIFISANIARRRLVDLAHFEE